MRAISSLVAVCSLFAGTAWSAANCLHSNSWQCSGTVSWSGQSSQTGGGIATTGQSPGPATTKPPLGGGGTSGTHPVIIAPPLPPEPKVPQPMPVVEPPKLPNKTPYLVPPQPVVKVPQPMPVVAPPKLPNKTPYLVPPQPVVQVPQPMPVVAPPKLPNQTPPLKPLVLTRPPVAHPHPDLVHNPGGSSSVPKGPAKVPQGPIGGTGVVTLPHLPGTGRQPGPQVVATTGVPTPVITGPKGPEGATHHLYPVLDPGHAVPPGLHGHYWTREVIEPGIQNERVTLYRSNDVREAQYKDVIPMDKAGFHLSVIGTRRPNYFEAP